MATSDRVKHRTVEEPTWKTGGKLLDYTPLHVKQGKAHCICGSCCGEYTSQQAAGPEHGHLLSLFCRFQAEEKDPAHNMRPLHLIAAPLNSEALTQTGLLQD